MGLFSFIKEAGDKLFGNEAAAAEAKGPSDAEVLEKLNLKVMQYGFKVDGLNLGFATGTCTVAGKSDPETCAKMVVVLGNTEGVGAVDDKLERLSPPKPVKHYTVVKGDTLSGIAKDLYAVALMYPTIFEANKPMLTHPDKIYPGQALIIPLDPAPLVHTVAAGETLGAIAKKYYGEAKLYTHVFESNTDQLSDPNKVKVGQALKITAIIKGDAVA